MGGFKTLLPSRALCLDAHARKRRVSFFFVIFFLNFYTTLTKFSSPDYRTVSPWAEKRIGSPFLVRNGACVVKTTTNSPKKRKKWQRHFFISKHISDMSWTPTKLRTSQASFGWLLSQNLRTWNLPAQCLHCVFISFDMLGCSQSKFSDNSKQSSTPSSSFIQNLHKGFYSSIAWPDERVSSRALGGMPRFFFFLSSGFG